MWTLHGTDIDRDAIEWSAANIPYATFGMNGAMPPTRYADRSFDLIYALSVFSHLDLPMERAWLEELTRLLKPGGFLYLTFNGQVVLEKARGQFPAEVLKRLKREGFAYFRNIQDGVLPEWYQTSVQTPSFMMSHVPPDSTVVRHEAGGHAGWQDAMLLQRTR